MEMTIANQVFLYVFGITVVLGAVVNKTNFCTMGAVSDVINIGDSGRMRAWALAMVLAFYGVLMMETLFATPIASTLPPYTSPAFAWLRYIVGGLLFGIGMTLGSGCGNKTLVRLGGGNLKSIPMLLVIGLFAYLMTKTSFFEVAFYPWVQATTIDLLQYDIPGQDLWSILFSLTSLQDTNSVRTIIGAPIVLIAIFMICRSRDFRSSWDNIIGGVTVGIAVAAGWYVTAGSIGQEWIEAADWLDDKPIDVAVQSFTFINPLGETLVYAKQGFDPLFLSMGMVAIAGIFVGSLLYSLVARKFRIEWFSSIGDFVVHMTGAVLMGIGGVLALGCTVGQGITGVSTLALGSFLTLGSIILGSALTMKFRYYRMVYEEEASVTKALVASLADFRLLPQSLRRLDVV